MQTFEIKNAEILYAQDNVDQRGIDIKREDLQAMVDAFRALNMKGRVPLKFGHNDSQPLTDGQPALGWVDSLWVDGSSLKANFSDVPRAVYDLIKAGMYKFVSVEMLQNVQAGTRKLPWVLTAVALLGADQPALGNLADLQSLLSTRKQPELRASRRLAFSQQAHFSSTSSEVRHMDETLVQAAVDKAINAVKVEFSSQINTLQTEHKKAIEQKEKELKEQAIRFKTEQIDALFNAAIESKDIIPAIRTEFYALTSIARDPSRVLDVELSTVSKFIKDHPNADKPKGMATRTGGDTGESAGTASQVVQFRARKRVVESGGNANDYGAMNAAVSAELSSDKKLADAYFNNPNAQYVEA